MANGLAGAGAPVNQQGLQAVEEVKAMLMQGATPEELIGMGIPEDVIMLAIQELEAELAQQPQAQIASQPPRAGLAAQGMA